MSHRKQRILSLVLAAVCVPAMAAFFVYLFATGSPDAVPLLLGGVGFVVGYVTVYLATRYLGGGSSSPGRLVRGGALALLCAAGFAVNLASPFDGTASELFLKGLGNGVSLMAFLSLFLLLLPPNDSGWVR